MANVAGPSSSAAPPDLEILCCDICAEPYTTEILQCVRGHSACGKCWRDWLRNHNSCPNCRVNVALPAASQTLVPNQLVRNLTLEAVVVELRKLRAKEGNRFLLTTRRKATIKTYLRFAAYLFAIIAFMRTPFVVLPRGGENSEASPSRPGETEPADDASAQNLVDELVRQLESGKGDARLPARVVLKELWAHLMQASGSIGGAFLAFVDGIARIVASLVYYVTYLIGAVSYYFVAGVASVAKLVYFAIASCLLFAVEHRHVWLGFVLALFRFASSLVVFFWWALWYVASSIVVFAWWAAYYLASSMGALVALGVSSTGGGGADVAPRQEL